MIKVDKDLINYVESNIMPQYVNNNYGGHGWEHIQDVINRSFELMEKFTLDINPNMVYVIAAYHDIGYRQDPDNHEQVSSEMFLQDKNIHKFFNEEEIKIIHWFFERIKKIDNPWGYWSRHKDRRIRFLKSAKRLSHTRTE